MFDQLDYETQLDYAMKRVRVHEYECGIDLVAATDVPEAVLESLFTELTAAIRTALRNSKIAAEWEINELGTFGERV
jgi:hypothetical protein